MSYLGYSVKEVVDKINKPNNGWYLPAIQRPYVWGSRHENELYICKLFDSILQGYPIGGLIVWETEEEIPFREFISDYTPDKLPKLVEKGLHGKKDKGLIYDGQQRLQTLYSCLRYTFNEKILIYDLTFDLLENDEPDETGFSFIPKNSDIKWYQIRMNRLFTYSPDDRKINFKKELRINDHGVKEEEEIIIEENLEKLWDVFVKDNTKSIAYYPIKTKDERVVNEVFERLNTGGMALSLSDLLFSKIKEKYYDFEEELQVGSKKIYDSTGKGYLFSAYSILQLLNLIVKKRVRVDPKKVNNSDIIKFKDTWSKIEVPLGAFFTEFIWEQFKINNSSIVPKKLALLPLIVYFYEIFNKGFSFKDINSANFKIINQYFIKSQINDWNLQTYSDNFTKIITEKSSENDGLFDFPLDDIESFILEQKKRNIDIYEETFIGYNWFALKIMTPDRTYQFEPDIKNRFNPEIDHIFPKKLKGTTDEYKKSVDIVWNMQPTRGEINGYKTNIHPKEFFTDQFLNKKGDTVIGSKYIDEYNFLFPLKSNNEIDFDDNVWLNPLEFIEKRKGMMKDYLSNKYSIILKK